MDVTFKLQAFRSTISSNLLANDDFIDWEAVERRLLAISNSAAFLQRFVDGQDFSVNALASALRAMPSIYEILLDLVAFNGTGAQVEKWGLPQRIDPGSSRVEWVAQQLIYIGLPRILEGSARVEPLIRMAEVYKDSYRRRFRSGKKLESRVSMIVRQALLRANLSLDVSASVNPNALLDSNLRRSLNFVIAVGSRPIAGIATVFQNQSGGRQQRDLASTYPMLQERLNNVGMSLILIADGQGLREASDRTLTAMINGVRYPMTLTEAADGKLADAIMESATVEPPATIDQTALTQLIREKLRVQTSIASSDLPVNEDQARLALARYVSSNRRSSIALSPDGGRLSWTKTDWVERTRALKKSFDPNAALTLFSQMLSLTVLSTEFDAEGLSASLTAPPMQPFAQNLYIRASALPLDQAKAREMGHRSMDQAPGSPVAIYLTANPIADIQAHRKAQVFLPTNLIVVSSALLELIATDRQPAARLMDAMLTQSDLTKVSPFILNNATPARMFYGRESEAATILSTITTNSVAILGSRRIGKTSLIRRVQAELEEARFQVFFGDCQVVRTWNDFGELARKSWNSSLPSDFRPIHLSDMVLDLKGRGEGPVVIILDEIDQLLDWDQTHGDESVPEAFFRACRKLSQEGAAQFVFSGERRIASRLWDPQSPHWNFCRELQLTQLDPNDAANLLLQPLRAMNIRIEEEATFEEEAWRRASGHPQIVQFLGDRLIRLLDERVDRADLTLGPEDIFKVTNTFEFSEHYLNTYWGQATKFERALSRLIAEEPMPTEALFSRVDERAIGDGTSDVSSALRMLQLYGILQESEGCIRLRAEWFPNALSHFGNS
nr:hypothetical protein RTCK_00511 [Rhizobium sp. TCK]